MNALLDRLTPRPGRRELRFVGIAIALGVLLRLAYVIASSGHPLAGDEIEYDIEAKFAAAGDFLWSTTPYGDAHASTWKAPIYPGFLGIVYAILGENPDRAFAVQVLLFGPFTIGLTWLLGRRLFGITAGAVAALVVAFYPNAWQFEARLYSESIATPLTIAILLAVLTATVVGWRRVWVVGLLLGLAILVRPSSIILIAPIAVCWWAVAGGRDGTLRLAATVGVALLVIAPWSIRNATLDGPWVPVSVQSAAGYGVFNDDAAEDDDLPWVWRPTPRRDIELFEVPRTDGELYRELNDRMFDYIADHPDAFPKAFLYNGVKRLYDLRSAQEAQDEVNFQGRTPLVSGLGLLTYWVLAVLALIALVRLWRRGRRTLVLALAALMLAASVAFTTDGGTRYRAPFEPLIAVLAVYTVTPRLRRTRIPRLLGDEAPETDEGEDATPRARGGSRPGPGAS